MQTVIQVLCTGGVSLRQTIADDQEGLEQFQLKLGRQRIANGHPGWTEVRGRGNTWAALKISWDMPTTTLTCRVASRRLARPHPIASKFVDFLLYRYSERIKAVSIFNI